MSCCPSFFSPLDKAKKNHIYHWVTEEKASPQLVSQETGYSVATIRGIIKEKGGKLPSIYAHTRSNVVRSKAARNKPSGNPQEQQQQQQLSSNKKNQGAPPITGPNQGFQRLCDLAFKK